MQSTPRVVIPSPSRTFRKYCAQSKKIATSPNCKQITQLSGAATPRNSDAHKRIAVPQAFCVLWEHPRPSPKSGKVCRSDTRPGDVRERAARVEGNDSAPTQNATYCGVCALVCDFSRRAECVQATILTRAKKDYAAQRGRDACGTATRISASLFRRLSAFFKSASDQDPKAAKFAVLTPGHAGFPKRVKRSEGSNSAPIRNSPCFGV